MGVMREVKSGPWRDQPPYRHTTPGPRETGGTSQRAYLRERSLRSAVMDIAKRFCGTGMNGANVWPENMPRKVRRQIERDAGKRLFRRTHETG